MFTLIRINMVRFSKNLIIVVETNLKHPTSIFILILKKLVLFINFNH